VSGKGFLDVLRCLPPAVLPNLSLLDVSRGPLEYKMRIQLEQLLRKWQERGLRVPNLHIRTSHLVEPSVAEHITLVNPPLRKLLSNVYEIDVKALVDDLARGALHGLRS
jgi:hypothetical protein